MAALRIEHAGIVRQLGQRDAPGQPGIDLLRAGVRQRALRRQEVEHREQSARQPDPWAGP